MKYLTLCVVICAVFINFGNTLSKSAYIKWKPCNDNENAQRGDWSKVTSGNVTKIIVHHDYIYGIGTDKAVWRYGERHSSRGWTKIAPGNVTSISIHDGTLYGVHDDEAVWVCTAWRCKTWKRITEGSVTDIVVRDGYIFGIKPDQQEKDNAIWQTTYNGYWPWRRVTRGSTVSMAFTSNYLYGVGANGAVWKSPKDGSWPWKQITSPHNITQIAVSNNYIYGVSTDDVVWKSPFGERAWEKISGTGAITYVAVRLSSCGSGADIYGVGRDNDVWRLH